MSVFEILILVKGIVGIIWGILALIFFSKPTAESRIAWFMFTFLLITTFTFIGVVAFYILAAIKKRSFRWSTMIITLVIVGAIDFVCYKYIEAKENNEEFSIEFDEYFDFLKDKEVIATIDDEEIYKHEYEQYAFEQLTIDALKSSIYDELLEKLAEDENISVTDEEVQKEFREYVTEYGSEEEVIALAGMTKEQFLLNIEREIVTSKLSDLYNSSNDENFYINEYLESVAFINILLTDKSKKKDVLATFDLAGEQVDWTFDDYLAYRKKPHSNLIPYYLEHRLIEHAGEDRGIRVTQIDIDLWLQNYILDYGDEVIFSMGYTSLEQYKQSVEIFLIADQLETFYENSDADDFNLSEQLKQEYKVVMIGE